MDVKFMQMAIQEAQKAEKKDEVPIGAVIVYEGRVIARGHNLRESKNQSTAHAEIIAINKACKALGSWRLPDCELYVTLEPCPMCCGAIIQSRIRAVYFGAYDKKGGAVVSKARLFEKGLFNHDVEFIGGIMKKECSQMLTTFFKKLRG